MTSPETSSLPLPGSPTTLVLAVLLTHGAMPTRLLPVTRQLSTAAAAPTSLSLSVGVCHYLHFNTCSPNPSPQNVHTRCWATGALTSPGVPPAPPQLLIQAQLLLSLSPHRLALLPDYSPVRPRHTEHRPVAHTLSTVTRLGNDLDNGQQRQEMLLLMAQNWMCRPADSLQHVKNGR